MHIESTILTIRERPKNLNFNPNSFSQLFSPLPLSTLYFCRLRDEIVLTMRLFIQRVCTLLFPDCFFHHVLQKFILSNLRTGENLLNVNLFITMALLLVLWDSTNVSLLYNHLLIAKSCDFFYSRAKFADVLSSYDFSICFCSQKSVFCTPNLIQTKLFCRTFI